MDCACPAEDILREVWERIAFYTVASEDTFLGPPSELCSLVMTSRRMHEKLSWKHNTHLYARIFRLKFDAQAPERRLSERWLTTRCLTIELIDRFEVLHRIKAKQFKLEDLWKAYLMMIESDGKNEAQLLEYSGLESYLEALIVYRATTSDLPWFKDTALDSLVIWLLWYTGDRDKARNESHNFRKYVLGILHSVILVGYRHPSVYAPDVFFSLPVCDGLSLDSLAAPPPQKIEIRHYSHRLTIAAPVISSAAVLALSVRIDAFKDDSNLPYIPDLPLTRSDAVTQGWDGATVEDIHDFHLNIMIPVRRRPLLVQDDLRYDIGDEDESEVEFACNESGSGRCDEDWYRLVACHDPHISDTPLRGVLYHPGSMIGRWAGRLMLPDFGLYYSLLHSQTNPRTVSLRQHPLYWELEEHHCLFPNEPLPPGFDENLGEDLLNAWLPQGVQFNHLDSVVEVFDPNTGHTARYNTFFPGNMANSKAAYKNAEKVQQWISDESDREIAEKAPEVSGNPDSAPSYIDEDEYVDTVSHLCSGIRDILITGKTDEKYGTAWGEFTIVGRVRPWDGLILLLRTPTDPNKAYLGRWIFRGYLHDQNFVGRWRETSTPVDLIGYEGGFAVYRN